MAEAIVFCNALQELVNSSPEPLGKAAAVEDLKVHSFYQHEFILTDVCLQRKFFALQNKVEEQLSDAYSRSVRISSSELAVCSSVQGTFHTMGFLYETNYEIP